MKAFSGQNYDIVKKYSLSRENRKLDRAMSSNTVSSNDANDVISASFASSLVSLVPAVFSKLSKGKVQ